MKDQKSICALMLFAIVMLTMGIADAQTTAVGPYYANPAWDQKLDCTTPSNCPRFIVLANWNSAAVLDRETGLVWQRTPDDDFQWFVAHTRCRSTPTGGRHGWRLPTIQELMSLRDPAATVAPFLPPGHPFNVQAVDYWSANTSVVNASNAWFLRLGDAGVPLVEAKNLSKFVWCVRGGSGVDPQ